jgi:phage terminase large subunit-like protein
VQAYSEALSRLLALPESERRSAIKALPERARLHLLYDWEGFWGRAGQVWAPGEEIYTVYLAGRGTGKTRTGAEGTRLVAKRPWLAGGRKPRGPSDHTYGEGAVLGIAGRTANDVNETMLYGPSGLMTISPPWERPRHYPSKKLLVWRNGARARLFSGDVPKSFRGPNIGFLWADELAHWSKLAESWRTAKLMLRHGSFPRALITTTGLGVQALIELVYWCRNGVPVPADEAPHLPNDGRYVYNPETRVITGSTYENVANLASSFLQSVVATYEGDELADQELRGMILFERRGAPWSRGDIERCEEDELPEFVSHVIAVDPSVSDGDDAATNEPCECGIIRGALGADGVLYVLEDLSGTYSTDQWGDIVARTAVQHDVDHVAVEDNQGGELVEKNIRMAAPRARIRVRRVHATRDKATRCSLVNRVWKTGRAKHVGNPRQWVRLEHQMTQFDPTKPAKGQRTDRMDAVVWLALDLLGDGTDRRKLKALSNVQALQAIARQVRERTIDRDGMARPDPNTTRRRTADRQR